MTPVEKTGVKAPAWAGSFSPAQASGLGSGASPSHTVTAQAALKTSRAVEVGTYRCTRCGAAMLSLVERDEAGLALREEPLLCTQCAGRRDWARLRYSLAQRARSLEELFELSGQLLRLLGEE